MNLSSRKSRNGTLTLVIAVSIGIHVLGLVGFGAFKIVESITREEVTFQAPPVEPPPPIEEPPPQIEQRNQSSAPPRPQPITVDTPDVTIPSLNIDVNVESTSAYGRGSGGFGSGGGASIREMAIDSFNFLGKEFKGEGDKIMFIIDASGSMVQKQRGIKGYEIVANEIVKTLKGMQGYGSFNIVAFGKIIDTYRGSFTEATEERIANAQRWLMRMDPALTYEKYDGKDVKWEPINAGTYVHLALEEAFSKRPKMIILLTDGNPTGMKEPDIHKLIAKLQTDPKTPINTISYKSKDGRAFLQKVAKDSGGEYTAVE